MVRNHSRCAHRRPQRPRPLTRAWAPDSGARAVFKLVCDSGGNCSATRAAVIGLLRVRAVVRPGELPHVTTRVQTKILPPDLTEALQLGTCFLENTVVN